MAIITIRSELPPYTEYTVNTTRRIDPPCEADRKPKIKCECYPFFGVPLKLRIDIRADGSIRFYSWAWTADEGNRYLHTTESWENWENENGCFTPTDAQRETVAGLFSGRIKFDGLKLAVGASLQHVCPIDLEAEEKRSEKKIYLA